jgi:hypothetical protein
MATLYGILGAAESLQPCAKNCGLSVGQRVSILGFVECLSNREECSYFVRFYVRMDDCSSNQCYKSLHWDVTSMSMQGGQYQQQGFQNIPYIPTEHSSSAHHRGTKPSQHFTPISHYFRVYLTIST